MSMRVFFVTLLVFVISACATTRDSTAVKSDRKLPVSYYKGHESGEWDTPPKRIEGKAPVYPISLILSGKEGESIIAFTVGLDGKTKDFEVQSSTDERYANHAIIAIRKWLFEPALKDDVPVEARVRILFAYGF